MPLVRIVRATFPSRYLVVPRIVLFNSFSFILVFLPLTLLGFYGLARLNRRAAAAFLALASLVFYGAWDWHYVPLLAASICFNFAAAKLILRVHFA